MTAPRRQVTPVTAAPAQLQQRPSSSRGRKRNPAKQSRRRGTAARDSGRDDGGGSGAPTAVVFSYSLRSSPVDDARRLRPSSPMPPTSGTGAEPRKPRQRSQRVQEGCPEGAGKNSCLDRSKHLATPENVAGFRPPPYRVGAPSVAKAKKAAGIKPKKNPNGWRAAQKEKKARRAIALLYCQIAAKQVAELCKGRNLDYTLDDMMHFVGADDDEVERWLESKDMTERAVARIIRRALRRAMALIACGRPSVATSSTSGAVLRNLDGLPGYRRQSCNDRCCRSCAKRRSGELSVQYDEAAGILLRDKKISDGTLRQLILHSRATSADVLSERIDTLWNNFRTLRSFLPELKHCVAVLEIKYNVANDWFHPHLHIMFVGTNDIQRTVCDDENCTHERRCTGRNIIGGALPLWQGILGVRVDGGRGEGSQGGLFVNAKRNTKEAFKYITKGLALAVAEWPEHRATEFLSALAGLRTVRSYGRMRLAVEDVDPADTLEDAIDQILVEAETGRTFAAHESTAALLGIPVAKWSHSEWARECARELLWSTWQPPERRPRPTSDDEARRARALSRKLRRAKAKRWKQRQSRIRRDTFKLYRDDEAVAQRRESLTANPRDFMTSASRGWAE